MLITDIKQTCQTCHGSGQQFGFKEHASIQIHANSRCNSCQGKGFQLTELGSELWKVFEMLIDEKLKT